MILVTPPHLWASSNSAFYRQQLNPNCAWHRFGVNRVHHFVRVGRQKCEEGSSAAASAAWDTQYLLEILRPPRPRPC
jgi:hypothetical protein